MYRRSCSVLLICLVLSSVLALVYGQASSLASSPWMTLSGNRPLVIARGGFSGIFPDSSSAAYSLAQITSLSDVILWCDVQLTKDGAGICAPDIKLENSTSISDFLPGEAKTYVVNGVSKKGYFSIDYTLDNLTAMYLTQGIYSRTNRFDGNVFQILRVQDVATQLKPAGLWLNVQHDMFFTQHSLNMRKFILSTYRTVVINYISSPEVNFLKSIVTRVNATAKLVFRFLEKDAFEPTTNQTYGSLLSNLTFIKTFASGILVPKVYIWPVSPDNYLLPHTTLVSDAHKAGLEVYASDFVNDLPLPYNYSFDPVAEALSYVDNNDFSVDGVVSDFPITPSAAFDCFAHVPQNNKSGQDTPLVISFNGASGDYPGCTDLAYKKAITDGANIIDCPVQISQDRIPFCFSSINLIDGTNIAQTNYSTLMKSVPEIGTSGIFAFSLTWDQIRSLDENYPSGKHVYDNDNIYPSTDYLLDVVVASMYSPYGANYTIYRNPIYKSAGQFMTLDDFLELSKDSSVSGVLISIENAGYLIEKQSLKVTDAVLEALSKAGLKKKVMIQSTNSSVLKKVKEKASYELVYEVDELISDAADATVEDIKKFAHSVVISKQSVFPSNNAFLTGVTQAVPKLQKYNLSVYVKTFSNEFVSQAWDFFSDATVEVNSFFQGASIDGVITDFPKTSATYKKNLCLGLGDKTPPYMSPVQPGSLMQLIPAPYMPPAKAPYPFLTEDDIAEVPLSDGSQTPPLHNTPSASPPSGTGNSQSRVVACSFVSTLASLLATLFLL